MDEEVTPIIEAAMKIILDAGDAREENLLAIDALKESEVDQAKLHLKNAESRITEAHKTQTNQIQDEVRGKKSEYSLLFAHAQDTMMTVNSEILLTKSFLKVFEKFDERLNQLERKEK